MIQINSKTVFAGEQKDDYREPERGAECCQSFLDAVEMPILS